MRARTVAVWCALALLASCARTHAYTVDCNHDYADCDNQLSKLASQDEEATTAAAESATVFLPTVQPKISSSEENETSTEKPRSRQLHQNVEELQAFAMNLHNQSKDIQFPDLSDVNLDNEEDEMPMDTHKPAKDQFFTNLQAPFHSLIDQEGSEEEGGGLCKENNMFYKIGDKIERGCDETCECTPEGTFECAPRCKHPYIRRGRKLNDPLCFESPVDECCSIVACSTGNSDIKPISKIEVCRHNNETYAVGAKWHIGCEMTCSCERNSVVDCKPRCPPLPQSDKCINVQDPHDSCCEVQVCDVSEDVHEEAENATGKANTTADVTTEMMIKQETAANKEIHHPMRPLVLTEPIGSVKVLQNNSVKVTLMHMNTTEDPIHLLLSSDGGKTFNEIELKSGNMLLNLDGGKDYILKTKETDTNFNFTISASDSDLNEVPNEQLNASKIGCYQDGQFYAVGEEFHIGCSELCECTGQDTRECAALECPNHVGLELVSRGCVRWATSPPAKPPDCCPRTARCLSDGTCHYRGVAVPNWSEVPISLTGCEERCFCENGELDCQEVCSPLPPVPPQTLRCPPMHRAAPVNISDEDCCKQWGCLPNLDMTVQPARTTLDYAFNIITDKPTPYPFVYKSLTKTEKSKFLRTKNLNPLKNLVIPKIIHNTRTETKNGNHNHMFSDLFSSKENEHENATVLAADNTNITYKVPLSQSIVYDDWDKWPSFHSFRKTLPKKTSNFSYSKMTDIKKQQPKSPISLHDAYFNDIKISASNKSSTLSHVMFIPSKETVASVTKQPIVTPIPIKLSTISYSKHIDIRKYYPKLPISLHDQYFNDIKNTVDNGSSTSSPLMFIPSNNQKVDTVTTNPIVSPIPSITPKLQNPQYVFRLPEGNDQTTSKYILMKPVDHDAISKTTTHDPIYHIPITASQSQPKKYYMTSKFDDAKSQTEIEDENAKRSAVEKVSEAGATMAPVTPKTPPPPPAFLPTIPPEIQFPHEDIPDYDQNNIHRPPNPPPLPPGLPPIPGLQNNYGEENKKLSVITLQADSPTSIKMLFGLPPVLVGLRGSVDLRYTDKDDKDITHWYSQVFAPADEVLTTSRLEFRLTGLKPSTVYKVRGKLFLHNLPVEPESEVYSVRTQDLPVMEEKQREIDSNLALVDVNDTTAVVSWRHFTEDELRFIDGVQVRYRPVGTPIYLMTELLHHSRINAELKDLRPGVRYEANLVLIAPLRATTELNDPAKVQFTTAPFVDPYNWSVTVEARSVGSEAVEVTWRGVPPPAERWVRVYRAAHACGDLRATEHDAFRLAARDQPPVITLTGLKPDAKCRIWLELFLTNGKVKTSNVLEVNTKSLDSNEPIDNTIEASSIAGSRGPDNRGDYYGALVVVGVVAALGAVTSLLLLLIVLRRHRPRSADITPVPSAPRDSSLPPYDNPAYKLELQQETMDL